MQTLEFTRALKEIVTRMRVDELLTMLTKWVNVSPQQTNHPISDEEKSQFSDLVFGSYAGYALLTGSEATRKILEGLDAKDFYDPNRLRILVSAISGFGNYGQARGFAETHALYEKLRSLQRLEATCRTLLEREKVGTVDPADEILRLELVDYDGKGIEPERLKQLIVIVRRLYMNLSRVHGIEGDRLRFKYFDSGSSLLIGIQGAKEVIQSMGTLLLQWWDKNRFARFDTFEKKMEAVSKSLTVMEEVKHSVEKNVINEETGRNLARRILVEVDQLVGIGATVPLDAAATVDQRELLLAKRDVKLLESGKPTDVEDDDSVS